MATPALEAGRPWWTARRRLSEALWARPWLRAAGLLTPPLAWLVLVYLLALAALFVNAFWRIDEFTSEVVREWTLDNFRTIVESSSYRTIALRTVGIAAAVTVTDAILALPLAYFMARIASPRLRAALFVCVVVPLWASYLARVYSWRLILSEEGVLNWTLAHVGLPTIGVGYSLWAMWIVFSYIWLPFMILPVFAAIERIPASYLEASQDLGARGLRTTRSIVLPLALPGIVAGSIFTTRPSPTTRRSSSGRRRSPTADSAAARTASRTRSGSRPGRRSRARRS